MSEAFKSIAAGLTEALQFTQGKPVAAVAHEFKPIDVKAIHSQVGMPQREFSAPFGISLGTLRHWEQGTRHPHGPARVLLNVVAKEPAVVLRALAS